MSLAFNSLQYAAFLAVVVLLVWLLPRSGRRWLLLVGSYGFYATFDWRFTPLLVATTVVHLGAGRQIARTRNPERRKLWLAVAVLFSLGVLGWFKYAGWLSEAFASLLGTGSGLGVLALPIGISYYTFHTLSYTIDVYRGEQEPTDDVLGFALFVAYFPQLLAGPLTRARRMLPQFGRLPARLDPVARREGLELILIGLFQKVALADALTPITSAAFIDTTRTPSPDRNWLLLVLSAMAGFAQFVFDLAGYSNIARGSSKLLGIELPHNFRQPLTRARNLQDYWRRHHLTLMAWFRDYVFRPLRARFGTKPPAAFALVVVVFTLSGIWHGASAGWLIWGVVIGLSVAVETVVLRRIDQARRARKGPRRGPAIDPADEVLEFPAGNPYRAPTPGVVIRGVRQVRSSVLCLVFLGLTIVLIRAPSLGAAGAYYAEIARFRWVGLDRDTLGLLAYVVLFTVLVDRREARLEQHEGRGDDPTTYGRLALWCLLALAIVVFSGTASRPFVYFGF